MSIRDQHIPPADPNKPFATPPAQSGMLEKLCLLRKNLRGSRDCDTVPFQSDIVLVDECIAIEQQRASQQRAEEVPGIIKGGVGKGLFVEQSCGIPAHPKEQGKEEEQKRAALAWMQAQAKALDPGSDGSSVLDCARIISGRLAHPKEPAPTYLSRDYEKLREHLNHRDHWAIGVAKGEVFLLRMMPNGTVLGRGFVEWILPAHKERFMNQCKALNLEWVSPHPTPSVLSREVVERVIGVIHGLPRYDVDYEGVQRAKDGDLVFIDAIEMALEDLSSSPVPTQQEPTD